MAAKKKKTQNILPSWDLSALYSGLNAPEIKQDFAKARTLATAFQKNHEGKVAKLSGNELAKAIKEYEKIEDILGRVSSYAQLVYAADMATEEHGRFYQNTVEEVNDISLLLLFFTLELNEISETELKKKLTSPALKHYSPWIRDVRVFRPYQLSQELEEILHEKHVTGKQALVRLFDETMADLRFPYKGEELTCSEILNHLSSHKSAERKAAAQSLGKVLKANAKTFAFITNTLAKDKSIEDNKRGFARPISSRNLANFIEDDVVDCLIHTVTESYTRLSHRYYNYKAKLFKKTQLDYWDRNAPLPNQSDRDIPWEEAVDIVMSAYQEFSPKMAKLGQDFFDKNWIDVPPKPGKDSGAFAHPTVPSAHPFLLLNYQGKPRDVMTLAHELGHGIHQRLSAKQGALMCDTPLTLAETASVFGEQLTFRSLLEQEKDKKQQQIMIANKVEDMLNTVVRQVAFCEFERHIHDERTKGELSIERINEIWCSVQRLSLGKAIKFDDNYAYFWSYIPHFIHSPFYVYSYAFGDCLVNTLYSCYLEKPEGFAEKYLAMLEAGGTLHHKELLKPFGLDASDPLFWRKGLNVISSWIDRLEA